MSIHCQAHVLQFKNRGKAKHPKHLRILNYSTNLLMTAATASLTGLINKANHSGSELWIHWPPWPLVWVTSGSLLSVTKMPRLSKGPSVTVVCSCMFYRSASVLCKELIAIDGTTAIFVNLNEDLAESSRRFQAHTNHSWCVGQFVTALSWDNMAPAVFRGLVGRDPLTQGDLTRWKIRVLPSKDSRRSTVSGQSIPTTIW